MAHIRHILRIGTMHLPHCYGAHTALLRRIYGTVFFITAQLRRIYGTVIFITVLLRHIYGTVFCQGGTWASLSAARGLDQWLV